MLTGKERKKIVESNKLWRDCFIILLVISQVTEIPGIFINDHLFVYDLDLQICFWSHMCFFHLWACSAVYEKICEKVCAYGAHEVLVINCCRIIVGRFWGLETDSFVFWSHSLVIIFLLVEVVKGIKDRRKKLGISLDSNFMGGSTTIL